MSPPAAGVLDHGAGMSATFLDYDNDGLLDIYTGNMWSAPGLRVTSAPGVHARCDAGGARALSPARPRQFAVAKPRQWTLRGQRRSRRTPRWAAGRGRRTRSISTATAGTISTSSTAC